MTTLKNEIKLSDYLADYLHQKEITHVFELSGGMITHILDSLSQKKKIKIISMHHEQGASFAAEAYGRLSNKPGVALATSGPGATNLLTGIGSCYFDSVPAIFITGQVNTHEIKKNNSIRQLGFQETDIISMAKPITKAAYLVSDANQFPRILDKAFQIAMSGRPGPVLIDIPMNIQRALIPALEGKSPQAKPAETTDLDFEKIMTLIQSAKKPLILAGRGLRASQSAELFLEMISNLQIPVCLSLLGLDVLPYENPLRVGFFGTYGNRWANQAIADSDLLLVLGARLDIRQTGADVGFFSNRKIIQVDCEEGELNNRVQSTIKVHAELQFFLNQFCQYLQQKKISLQYPEWLTEISKNKSQSHDTKELTLKSPEQINPNVLMHAVSKYNPYLSYSVDVGAHQMWAAQSLELHKGQYFITSGGMGAMGYSLPASIGGALALKSGFVVIVGDGSMQLNIQELQTIYRNNIPIKIIVMNNQSLGMIKQFQDSYFESRYQSTVWGYSAPDFEKVATAYGIQSKTVAKTSEVDSALKWMFSKELKNNPCLLQVMIDSSTNIYPKTAFGRPLHQMEPSYKPVEIEST